jgi:hypothetical protein
MKFLKDLTEVKIGQKVAWGINAKSDTAHIALKHLFEDDPDPEAEVYWVFIAQVKGFHQKTKYPKKENGHVYTTQIYVDFDVLVKDNNIFPMCANFLDITVPFKRKNDMNCKSSYSNNWKVFLLENNSDYMTIIKELMVNNL